MKSILVFGAGRSSGVLIEHLLNNADPESLQIIVADTDPAVAEKCIGGHPAGKAMGLDINSDESCGALINNADLVISMLPVRFHWKVVRHCLNFKKSLVTASYSSSMVRVSDEGHEPKEVTIGRELKELDAKAKEAGIAILTEIGLDPGIDHMSAMKLIHDIQEEGGKITSFKSFTGGLVAPEYDNNPWHYKFTWNPKNVVLAGQGVAQFLRNGRFKHIPYHKVFNRTEKVSIPGAGDYEGYPNRDSLSYRETYGIQDVPTIIRGTLRMPGFCHAWSLLVELGITDDSYEVEDVANMTYRDFTNSFLGYNKEQQVEDKLCEYLNISREGESFKKLEWLGLFSEEKLKPEPQSPARILQDLLEEKWSLEEGDKDMIVMQHQFEYTQNGAEKKMLSSLVVKGDDTMRTAMAKTVGYPVAIAALHILNGTINITGVHTPVQKVIYIPVMKELNELGISFVEE